MADQGIDALVGTTVDSYNNALTETIIGLLKTEVIHHRGLLKGVVLNAYLQAIRAELLCNINFGQDGLIYVLEHVKSRSSSRLTNTVGQSQDTSICASDTCNKVAR